MKIVAHYMILIVNGANKHDVHSLKKKKNHDVHEQLKSCGANKLDYVLIITCLQRFWQSVLLIPK